MSSWSPPTTQLRGSRRTPPRSSARPRSYAARYSSAAPRLLRARRLVRRQRDYVERAADEIRNLAGFDPGQHHQLRDVAGQMIRTADRIDDALDRLANALDVLNSTVANRLNTAMERLTVVATIFLPLTVVTGFFGQNFGWMLDRIDSLAAFLVLGVGVFAVSGLVIYLWIRARLTRAD